MAIDQKEEFLALGGIDNDNNIVFTSHDETPIGISIFY
jgi:hypothetical protein